MKKLRKMKRILGISMMVLSILVSQIPITARADESGDFVIVDNAILGYHGTGGDIVLPDNATMLGNVFMDTEQEIKKTIKSLYIPKTITRFVTADERIYPNPPFQEATASALLSLHLPWLEKVEVDANNPIFSSYDGALYETASNTLILCPYGKKSMEIKEGTTDIEFLAIEYDCKLEYVHLPASYINTEIKDGLIGYVGAYTPFLTQNLVSFTVNENNPALSAKDGILYDKEQKTLIQCPPKKTGDIIIPDTVTTIKKGAFSATKATSITIPKSVITIEDDENSVIYMLEGNPNILIYCYKDSTAEEFAKKHGIKYSLIDEPNEPENKGVAVENTNSKIEHPEAISATVEGTKKVVTLKISETKNGAVKQYIISNKIVPDTNTFEALEMNIELVDETGNLVTNFTSCTINIPIPSSWTTTGSLWVGTIKSDGQFEKLSCTTIDVNGVKCVQFTTNHFSEYAIINEQVKKNEDTNTGGNDNNKNNPVNNNPNTGNQDNNKTNTTQNNGNQQNQDSVGQTTQQNNTNTVETPNNQGIAVTTVSTVNSGSGSNQNAQNVGSDSSYMPKTGIDDLVFLRDAACYGSFLLGLYILLLSYKKNVQPLKKLN